MDKKDKKYILRGFQSLGDIVEQSISPMFERKGAVQAKIYSKWSTIVGEGIAQKTSPSKITYAGKEKSIGTLHINVFSADALEISYMEGVLIEKIAVFFGYKAIDKIKIKQKPYDKNAQATWNEKKILAPESDHPRISSDLMEQIEDEDLQKALSSLSRSVKS